MQTHAGDALPGGRHGSWVTPVRQVWWSPQWSEQTSSTKICTWHRDKVEKWLVPQLWGRKMSPSQGAGTMEHQREAFPSIPLSWRPMISNWCSCQAAKTSEAGRKLSVAGPRVEGSNLICGHSLWVGDAASNCRKSATKRSSSTTFESDELLSFGFVGVIFFRWYGQGWADFLAEGWKRHIELKPNQHHVYSCCLFARVAAFQQQLHRSADASLMSIVRPENPGPWFRRRVKAVNYGPAALSLCGTSSSVSSMSKKNVGIE